MIRTERRANQAQAGFTIVELMVASLVFTVILGVITSGIVHFTSDYYKGINTSATQTTARSIANIIAQNLEYGGGANTFSVPTVTNGYDFAVCIGSTQIQYVLGSQLTKDPSPYGVIVTKYDPALGCQSFPSGNPGGKEMLGPKMRLTNLSVDPITTPSGSRLYTVSVGVAYGEADLLCSTNVPVVTNPGSCASGATVSLTASDHAFWNDPKNGAGIRCRSGSAGDMRTQMHADAFPGEDISDRPLPEEVVPVLLRLLADRPESGRYRAADLVGARA